MRYFSVALIHSLVSQIDAAGCACRLPRLDRSRRFWILILPTLLTLLGLASLVTFTVFVGDGYQRVSEPAIASLVYLGIGSVLLADGVLATSIIGRLWYVGRRASGVDSAATRAQNPYRGIMLALVEGGAVAWVWVLMYVMLYAAGASPFICPSVALSSQWTFRSDKRLGRHLSCSSEGYWHNSDLDRLGKLQSFGYCTARRFDVSAAQQLQLGYTQPADSINVGNNDVPQSTIAFAPQQTLSSSVSSSADTGASKVLCLSVASSPGQTHHTSIDVESVCPG